MVDLLNAGVGKLMKPNAMLSMKTKETNAVSWPDQEGSETGLYAWRTFSTDINSAEGIDA